MASDLFDSLSLAKTVVICEGLSSQSDLEQRAIKYTIFTSCHNGAANVTAGVIPSQDGLLFNYSIQPLRIFPVTNL